MIPLSPQKCCGLCVQVSAILIDGKEQQKYITVSGTKKQDKPKKVPDEPKAARLTSPEAADQKSKPQVMEDGEDLALPYPIAYLHSFPEAPYLKPALMDVKELAHFHPDKVPQTVSGKQFPDLQLIYTAICT
jgi:hypothetical protein